VVTFLHYREEGPEDPTMDYNRAIAAKIWRKLREALKERKGVLALDRCDDEIAEEIEREAIETIQEVLEG